MVVIVLTACKASLRGELSRWLLEISPGVFVGDIGARVRGLLWDRVEENVRDGRAIMVYSSDNEQHLSYAVHNSSWQPVDCDGLMLIRRPLSSDETSSAGSGRHGWSKASKYHRAHKYG